MYSIGPYISLEERNKVLYLKNEYGTELIIDNKNLSGDTLGKRRVRLASIEDIKVYPLHHVHFSMYDVFNSKYKLFIDSNGILTSTIGKHRRELVYRKVLKSMIYENTMICKCAGIFKPIIIPFIPKITPKYLGLLVVNGDYHLYDLTQERKNDSWRKW